MVSPKKVLHITRNIDPTGGCEIYIRNLISLLASHAIESAVVTAVRPSEAIPNSKNNYTIDNLAALDHNSARASLSLFSPLLEQIKPDLIHIHDLNNPYIIEYCGKNYPTVKTTLNADAYCGGIDKYLYNSQKECKFSLGFHCLGIAYLEKCMKRHPRRGIEIISVKKRALDALRYVSKVVVPSEASRTIMVQNKVTNEQILTVPLFADFTKNEVRRDYPRSNPNILFLGRLRPYKGVHFLLKAAAQTRSQYPVHIVGDGEERLNLESLAARLNLTNRVRFHGNVAHDQVSHFLNDCSLLVVPSIYPDSFPTVGLEAMKHARPVVGFNIGGIPEWLTDSKTGFLVPTQNVSQLADRIDYLLTHHNEAEAMGKLGALEYKDKFSPRAHLALISHVYETALSGKVNHSLEESLPLSFP